MSIEVPDWLKNVLIDDAFIPSEEFIEHFEPQSRIEALIKYGILNHSSDYGQYMVRVSDGSSEYQAFEDANGDIFCVKS